MLSTHQAPEEGGWEHHQLHSIRSAGAYCQAVFNENGEPVDFVHLEVNESFKRFFGLKNFVGLKASEIIPDIENRRKEFITRHLEVARTGITDTFACHFNTQDTWYTITVSSHQQWFFTSVIKKINDVQLAQKELRLSKELLEEAVVAAQVGIWDWFIETGEVFVNEIWAGIIGYTLKELEPLTIKTWKDLLHPDDLRHANAGILGYFNGGADDYALEFRMRHKDGYWVWINCSTKIVSRTPEGKPLRLLGVHKNINRQKESEAEAQKKEDQFRLFFDNHSEPILCIEPNAGTIVNANQAAVNFYGWSRDELCRMSIEQINTRPMVQILAQMRMAGSSNHVKLPSVHRTATGSLREVEVYTSSIPVEGQLLLYLVIHDVTERKQAEEKVKSMACLAKAISDCNQTLIHVTNEAKSGEKDALLLAKETIAELSKREKLLQEALASERLIAEQQRRFLSLISHEYRTPIAIINGNLDILMLNEKSSTTIQADAMDKMKRAVKRLMEVMDTSLEQCRFFDDANSAAYQLLDLPEILCEQLADAAVLWPDRFYCRAEGIKGIRVLADQTFLNVTIFNLLDNARKYSPPNSPIRVDCRKDGANVAIIVINQANSASPFIGDDLFKKYARGSNSANTGGAGMGLWLVREIVEMYQGTITIESEPQGVVATLRLPFVDDATSIQLN